MVLAFPAQRPPVRGHETPMANSPRRSRTLVPGGNLRVERGLHFVGRADHDLPRHGRATRPRSLRAYTAAGLVRIA